MDSQNFRTLGDTVVASVTATQMKEVDRVAIEEIGINLLQMMENAGRSLAMQCRRLRENGSVVILAGAGGNGGGGLACARHLSNGAVPVTVVIDREPSKLEGAVATQYGILEASDVSISTELPPLDTVDLVVDSLIGYGLQDAPRGRPADLIATVTNESKPVLSLDVPSGVDATTGRRPGISFNPETILTLALPKTGLKEVSGELFLADIGIPPTVYRRLEIRYQNPFSDGYLVKLER